MKTVFKYFLNLLIFFPIVTNAFSAEETFTSPKDEGKAVSFCTDNTNSCTIYVVTKSGKKIDIVANYERPFQVIWHDNRLVEISLSCGSPCRNSFFVDIYKDKKGGFPLTLAVDTLSDLVAYAEQSTIIIKGIFQENNEPLEIIKRDFSPVASLYSAINKIQFLENGCLYLSYLSGENFEDKSETIPLK